MGLAACLTHLHTKLYKHLHVVNSREQSCLMMIMEGNKMYKTEYGLKLIMYSAYDTPH